jgi:integrase
MKLTAKAVAALTLPAGKTDVIHFDDQLPGFGHRLRIGAGGKLLRSWVCQYRHAGQTRRLLLGSAAALGAEQARTMARKALGRVANGEDPQAHKLDRRGKDKHTLKATVDDYLAAKQPQLRPRSFVETKRYLTSGYFKVLHGMPLDTITRRDVAARVVAIVRESGSPTAARARGALSSFFVWCMQMGLVENNPTIGATKPAENQPRERVLADAELAAIWRACGDDDHGRCVRLLILTGCRRAEIGGMAWSEIDLERGVWVLPAARSKNGRSHTLPLLPTMLAIIEAVPRMAGRDQLFGQRANGFTGWSRGKVVLAERSGVTSWTTHDIRRSVATKMADLGVQPHIIETVLNHRSGHKRGPAGIYNHSVYTNGVCAALALWHDHLRTLVAGGKRKIIPYAPHAAS